MHTSITTLKKKTQNSASSRQKKICKTSLPARFVLPQLIKESCIARLHITLHDVQTTFKNFIWPNHFTFSPLQLSLSDWNSLPENIVNIQESSGFRAALATFFKLINLTFLCFSFLKYLLCISPGHFKSILNEMKLSRQGSIFNICTKEANAGDG